MTKIPDIGAVAEQLEFINVVENIPVVYHETKYTSFYSHLVIYPYVFTQNKWKQMFTNILICKCS